MFSFRFDELMVKKSVPKMTKSAVYSYIADKFGMKTKTLLGRLRKLKELKDDSLLEPMLISLKDGALIFKLIFVISLF